MLVSLKQAIELTGLSKNTLRKYADSGQISSKRFNPRGKRLYDRDELISFSERCRRDATKPIICYCRVSSSKQSEDLGRQVSRMREAYPNAEIIQDIGSGLNFKRKGLKTLLDRCMCGDKFTLIITYRDRLCRFGYEVFEYLIKSNGGEILVLNCPETSPESELTGDLLSILHVFSCRMHGLRSYTNKIKKDKTLPH